MNHAFIFFTVNFRNLQHNPITGRWLTVYYASPCLKTCEEGILEHPE